MTDFPNEKRAARPIRKAVIPTLALIGALLAACASPGGVDKPANDAGIGYSSVAEAMAALRAKPGVDVREHDGWVVIGDHAESSVWSFTPAGHPAHPAAIKRSVAERSASIGIRMQVLCEAERRACDALVREFNQLNAGASRR